MENVTDEISNPFGMRPPCPEPCAGGHTAVFGYGDANADFHVIGDHPGVHGGTQTGIPFTGTEAGERVLDVLEATALLTDRDGELTLENCFLSYLYLCCVADDETPSRAEYDEYERFFDAELRAISADVLVPVGGRATDHVLSTYTARGHRYESHDDLPYGRVTHGRGVLVFPLRDPTEWTTEEAESIARDLGSLRDAHYQQMVDLGRFLPGGDPYLVR